VIVSAATACGLPYLLTADCTHCCLCLLSHITNCRLVRHVKCESLSSLDLAAVCDCLGSLLAVPADFWLLHILLPVPADGDDLEGVTVSIA
jgi:hypothetical protein